MKGIYATLLLLSASFVAYSQDGKVEVIGDAEVEMLLDKKIASVDTTDLWGYRIQVYFGNDRKEAKKTEQLLKSRYPELSTEIYRDYYQPNWKVRVGNFYRKIDAQKLMMKLEDEFGDVFLVRDIIDLPAVF
ncbi:MAG: SPOR domain-containing protein [Bacteroidetes bacterium]|jgi:hypothetical protein|nr:SPOR domain-containing protein [Bacteroidota bacterium]